MKANELRVGNWVNDELYGDFEIIGLINFKDGNQSAYKSLEYYPQSQDTDKLNPIPLTEEWLIKFGFEKHITIDTYPTFAKQMFNWNDSILYLIGCGFINHIKYVHQLQNLYFALTNEELICHT